MIKQFALPVVIAGTLLAGSSVQAATIVNTIDPLDNSAIQQAFLIGGSLTQPADRTTVGGLLNGTNRNLFLDVIQDNGNISSARVPSSGATNGFSLSNEVDQSTDAILTYSNFPAPVDFTQGGADRFIIRLTTNDRPGNSGVITVNGVSFAGTGPVLNPGETFDLELPYSAFPGVNFGQVTSFSLQLDAVAEGDLAIGLFATGTDTPIVPTTPEPTTMLGLLAIGAYGFASRRRQK